MNRDEFFQLAFLKMAEKILDRADTVPTPEQLAKKSREYAQALHDEMLAGLTNLDMIEEMSKGPTRHRQPVSRETPTLAPIPKDIPEEMPDCPECKGPMRVRNGRFGPFFGCSGYPNCKGIINIPGPRG